MKKTVFYFLIILYTFWHIPEAYGFDYNFEGMVSTLYDDNVYQESNKKGDLYNELMVGLGINHEGKIINFNLLGHLYQQLYYTYYDNNNMYEDASLDLSMQFSELDRLVFSEHFYHYPTPGDFNNLFGRESDNEGYISNIARLGYDRLLSRFLQFSLFYTNKIMENKSKDLDDSVSHGSDTFLKYYLSSRNIIYILYSFTYIEYDTNINMREHKGGFRFEHFFTKQLSVYGILGGGYLETSTDNTYLYPYYEFAINDDLDKNNTIQIIFTRELGVTQQDETPYDNWRITARYSNQILERLIIFFNSFYGYGEDILEESENTINRLLGVNFSISYLLTEHITINTGYVFTKHDEYIGDDYLTGYTKNVIRLSFVAEL